MHWRFQSSRPCVKLYQTARPAPSFVGAGLPSTAANIPTTSSRLSTDTERPAHTARVTPEDMNEEEDPMFITSGLPIVPISGPPVVSPETSAGPLSFRTSTFEAVGSSSTAPSANSQPQEGAFQSTRTRRPPVKISSASSTVSTPDQPQQVNDRVAVEISMGEAPPGGWRRQGETYGAAIGDVPQTSAAAQIPPADWSALNPDVFHMVLMKLRCQDLISASGVCCSWRDAAVQVCCVSIDACTRF